LQCRGPHKLERAKTPVNFRKGRHEAVFLFFADVRFAPESGRVQRTSACPLRARSRYHCGRSSFGKLFILLGTAGLTAAKLLRGEPGLGATTLAPTTRRAAITMRTMDSLWRMAASILLRLDCYYLTGWGQCDRLHIGLRTKNIVSGVVRHIPNERDCHVRRLAPRRMHQHFALLHVSFTSKAEHMQCTRRCPLWTAFADS